MNYNNITGLYTCPFCGTISPIDYGVSCGCLYDDMPTTNSDTDFFKLVDWMPVENENFLFGYSDDSEIISGIKGSYDTIDKDDFFIFTKNNKEYRLYF